MTTIWKASWALPQWETHDIPTLPKITFDAIKHAFPCSKVELFPPHGKEIGLPSPQGLS